MKNNKNLIENINNLRDLCHGASVKAGWWKGRRIQF